MKTAASSQMMLSVLNNYFASVCVDDDGSTPTIKRAVPEDVGIDTISFTPIKIAAILKKMQAKKSPGPDGFPPCLYIYIRLTSGLAEPLSLIFTSFMSTGSIPSEWRHALVSPVFKKGNAADPANYRSISLTSAACKIMERVIYVVIIICVCTMLLASNSMLSSLVDLPTQTS